MVRFNYTAQREAGEVYKGVADAADRFELYKVIRREGGKVISVKEANEHSIWNLNYWNARIATVPEQAKISFAQSLSAMLKAGLALSRALAVIERQTGSPRFVSVLVEISNDVRRGSAFHEALGRFPNVFSPLFVAMVKSGEESGNLAGALRTVGDQMERMSSLKKKVRGAMIYPAIIVVAITGIGTLMMVQVVPTLSQTFKELKTELPASTKAIIGLSDFLVAHTLWAIVIVVALLIAGFITARTASGRRFMDWAFLRIPVIGPIVRELNSARTARTISSLLTSGVSMVQAISITREVVQNSFFKDVLGRAEESIQKGEPFSKAFMANEDLYPPLVGEMIAVGEETGDLAGMLENLANFYEEEVSRKTKDMSTIIEPFLMLLIGGAVGFFAVAMVSPIYKLSDAI
jgi:type IV pilus assembly protein PilC